MSDPPDYYAILNVSSSATKEEITKAYRKRVFQVHPDKNPDLPNAKNLFNDVQKAYEVLSDEKAKEAYDALLKAKASRLKREREMDEKRKKMKEDLLAREREAKKQKTEEERARKLYEAELDRLRREGWSKLREQYAQQQQQQQQQQKMSTFNAENAPPPSKPLPGTALKVRWNHRKSTYDAEKLRALFLPYGDILHISARKKRALVVFRTPESASEAMAHELSNIDRHSSQIGDPGNKLVMTLLDDVEAAPPSPPRSSSAKPSSPPTPSAQSASLQSNLPPSYSSHKEFENSILEKLRKAAEQQKAQAQSQSQSQPLPFVQQASFAPPPFMPHPAPQPRPDSVPPFPSQQMPYFSPASAAAAFFSDAHAGEEARRRLNAELEVQEKGLY